MGEPYEGFGGRVSRTMAGSDAWWPDVPAPSPGAPNIVVILADDLGFADLGCYGSEISTPNLDRLAADGLRYTNFHVTPMCSPTRAALLTGLNPHRAGVGHIANSDPGFPGYASELADDALTIAETLRDAGYATLMVGKWHLAKDSQVSDASSKSSWPVQRGFDRFYGILDAFTNFHHPHHLVQDNTTVDVDRYPDGYYFTDDLTDHAIRMIRAAKASHPHKPFFLYFAHGAVHAPLQAKAEDMARYRGMYDAGWDRVREARHRRQLELGVIPPGTPLAPRNREEDHDVAAWDDLGEREQLLFARYMEVFAGMVDSLDQSVGRLRDALDELGELDNTIIIFTSDNGGSREGEALGTSQYFRTLTTHLGAETEGFEEDWSRLDIIGGPQTLAHYPRGWAMVSNTPFRLYKVNTHAGGHQVPFIVSWPARLAGVADRGGVRTQYAHVTDLVPTLLELAGVARGTHRHGLPVPPLAGTSFAATLDDRGAPSAHTEQYYEMIGHRGYYRDGWEVVTLHLPRTPFGDHEWELYRLDRDPNELHDLAGELPDVVRDLAAAWDRAAWANQVYPLDEGSGLRWLQRPPSERLLAEPLTIVPGTPTLERYRSMLLIQNRCFTVRVPIVFRAGDAGVLVAHGDQGGGYALYVEDGELRYAHNGYGTMTVVHGGRLDEGDHDVVLEVVAAGGWRWNIGLAVDGSTAAGCEGLRMPAAMAPFEGIDVGIDRRSPVSWDLYTRHGPFPYSGVLRPVTYTPGELAPDAGARFLEFLRELGRKFE